LLHHLQRACYVIAKDEQGGAHPVFLPLSDGESIFEGYRPGFLGGEILTEQTGYLIAACCPLLLV